MFHAFAIGGVKFVAFREDSNVTVFDDQFRNYGGWQSLDQFIRYYRHKDRNAIGLMLTMTRRCYGCCGENPQAEFCQEELDGKEPCEGRKVKLRLESLK